jgi:hypothetical protein
MHCSMTLRLMSKTLNAGKITDHATFLLLRFSLPSTPWTRRAVSRQNDTSQMDDIVTFVMFVVIQANREDRHRIASCHFSPSHLHDSKTLHKNCRPTHQFIASQNDWASSSATNVGTRLSWTST